MKSLLISDKKLSRSWQLSLVTRVISEGTSNGYLNLPPKQELKSSKD